MPDVLKHQKRMPAEAMPVARAKLELFRAAYRGFVEAGYRPIGMDHFALPTDELARAQERRTLGRNFQGYTVKAAADVVAVGSTGISDVAGAFAQNVRAALLLQAHPGALRHRARAGPERGRQAPARAHHPGDVQLLGGPGRGRADHLRARAGAAQDLRGGRLLVRTGNQLQLTAMGRLFVRNVAMVFDTYLAQAERPRFSQTV